MPATMHICKQCSLEFQVGDDDHAFYDAVSPVIGGTKIAIPPPTLCPDCRQQRRLAWRNERVLYARDCDLCKRHIVSVYPASAPFPVYCVRCWWSDQWDPESYGIAYDATQPFLQQFLALRTKVPQLAIQNDDGIGSENCEYCYDFANGKNCYRITGGWYTEDSHYCTNVNRSKNIVDCNTVGIHNELVYESLDSQYLYHCAYLQNCENCRDCFIGFDLKGCTDCIACYGLRQKKFHIFNQPYAPEEYKTKLREMHLGSFKSVQKLRAEFDAWSLQFPHKFAYLQNCEHSIGNNLLNCKNVVGWSVFDAEDCKFIDLSDRPKNCYDILCTGIPEWCYDCVTPDKSYMTHFSVWCWGCKYTLYSDNCHNCDHLMGCTSLRRGKYCILNKQYTKEEYERILPLIISSLRERNEWGALFPIRLSPFCYNESVAQEYFPLSKDEVIQHGWKWADVLPFTTGKETIQWTDLADEIADVPDSIVKEVLACVQCGKNFRLIPGEVSLYKQLPAPLPRKCADCRHLQRKQRKTPTKIWNRECEKCHKEVQTCFGPDRPEIVYCEECYLREMY